MTLWLVFSWYFTQAVSRNPASSLPIVTRTLSDRGLSKYSYLQRWLDSAGAEGPVLMIRGFKLPLVIVLITYRSVYSRQIVFLSWWYELLESWNKIGSSNATFRMALSFLSCFVKIVPGGRPLKLRVFGRLSVPAPLTIFDPASLIIYIPI